jgi:hypothetical protein
MASKTLSKYSLCDTGGPDWLLGSHCRANATIKMKAITKENREVFMKE